MDLLIEWINQAHGQQIMKHIQHSRVQADAVYEQMPESNTEVIPPVDVGSGETVRDQESCSMSDSWRMDRYGVVLALIIHAVMRIYNGAC